MKLTKAILKGFAYLIFIPLSLRAMTLEHLKDMRDRVLVLRRFL